MKNKVNVWLMRVGEPLPTDSGNQRLFRMGLIAEELEKKGVNVLWWTSSFDHNKKEFRAKEAKKVIVSDSYHIQLLHGCGYKKNASIGRFLHYVMEERQFFKFAKERELPDLILASMPNIDLAEAAVKFGKKHNIPVFVDIRDMWPDIYIDLVRKHKLAVSIAIIPMRKRLSYTLKNATGIFATSEKFLEWGINYAKRKRNIQDNYYYVSYPDTNVKVSETDLKYWYDMDLKKDDLICCFFGQFGYAVDLDTVMEASVQVVKTNPRIKFVICGMGEKLADYKKIVGNNENVIFPGWVNRTQICALGQIAHVGILSYRKTPNYEWSMPNKFCEYLALGLTVLIQPTGMMERMAKKHGCGYQYNTVKDLIEKLQYLDSHRDKVSEMKRNARELYDEQFRADIVYGKLAEQVLDAAKKRG